MESKSVFSKNGIVVSVSLIVVEYVLYALFFRFTDPDLWKSEITRFSFYITLFVGAIIILIIAFRQNLKDELQSFYRQFDDFPKTLSDAIFISIFSLGTFYLYHIGKANIFGEFTIYPFVDSNIYIQSAANGYAILGQILYPVALTFIVQGFLLNGLTYFIGYKKSTLLTSLFYGYWTQNIIGGTVFCLFLNHVYNKSSNIFYPAILTVVINLFYLIGYLLNPDIMLFKAERPYYNDQIMKGVFLTLMGLPVVIPMLKHVFQKRKNRQEYV